MENFKKALISLVMSIALVMSSSAFAEGATDAKVRASGEETVAAVEKALSLQEQGADKEEVGDALREARSSQKEFRFEGTERLRQKAGDKMRVARQQVKDGDPAATETLKELLAMYQEMMTMYKAAH